MKPHIQGASACQQLIDYHISQLNNIELINTLFHFRSQKFLNSFQQIKATLCRNWHCV